MNPETEFILEALDGVVAAQPEDHPLRRVDRDASLVYETEQSLDMTQPIHERTEQLKQANYVGVAWQSRDNEITGTNYNHETDLVASVRIEGLTRRGGEWGHIDPLGEDAPTFDELCHEIRTALLDKRTYPKHESFRDSKMDLAVTNEDNQSSDWPDFFRREFDLVFRGKEELP